MRLPSSREVCVGPIGKVGAVGIVGTVRIVEAVGATVKVFWGIFLL